MDALSAVIQMVLLSLPYILHSPTGTRHIIHLTPRSCTRARVTPTLLFLWAVTLDEGLKHPENWKVCVIRRAQAAENFTQTQDSKPFCLLNVLNVLMWYSKNLWPVAKIQIHQRCSTDWLCLDVLGWNEKGFWNNHEGNLMEPRCPHVQHFNWFDG